MKAALLSVVQSDLRDGLKMIGECVTDKTLDLMMLEADSDRDGKIDYTGEHIHSYVNQDLTNVAFCFRLEYCVHVFCNTTLCFRFCEYDGTVIQRRKHSELSQLFRSKLELHMNRPYIS